jgi:dTMP kinase
MNKGRYIVLEGPEGVGKTTQILELTRRLQAAGLPVRTLREPDSQSDLTARALRQLTQDPRYPMNTNTEVLLYNAARSQSLQVIKKSVEQGVICVVDRNYLTTLAVQYYGRGDVPDYETINRIIEFAVNGVEPDLCIVLDAPVSVLKERAQHRGQGERFDNLDEAFLERVRAGYLWEAKQRNLPVIFATDDEQMISESIWKLVAETLAVRDGSTVTSEPESVADILGKRKQVAAPVEPPLDTTVTELVVVPAEVEESPVAGPYLPSKLPVELQQEVQDVISSVQAIREELAGKVKLDVSRLKLMTTVAELAADAGITDEILANGTAPHAAIVKQLAATHGEDSKSAVTLLSHTPRNELDIVPTLLYPQTNLSAQALAQKVSELPYEAKSKLLSESIAEVNAALKTVQYSWDVLTDFASIAELSKATNASFLWQELSPRNGFDTPKVVEAAGLEDAYADCFDQSLAAHSKLQAAGFSTEAQFVTLGGHKQRCMVSMSLYDLRACLNSSEASKTAKRLARKLVRTLSDVHPLLTADLPTKK